jgi:GTP-binding protein
MIDLVKLTLAAGNGGDGKVSFRREKFVTKGGPDGGDGGNGGSITIRCVAGMTTLRDYAGVKLLKAERGQNGDRRKKFGEKGESKTIEVPVGTVLYLLGENKIANKRRNNSLLSEELSSGGKYYLEEENTGIPPRDPDDQIKLLDEKLEIFVFKEANQELLVCHGGRGGRGSVHFKSSVKTTPLEAEYGAFGEQKLVQLELKLLADLGLVGFPNAGKSTFLSKVTRANPKIANYPFTTIEPNLGIMFLGSGQGKDELVLADIPGLIEGASQGKGLGLDFLRHIENCQSLMFILYLDETVIYDSNISDGEKAKLLWQQYEQLRKELSEYDTALLEKSSLVTINKIDLYTDEQMEAFRSLFSEKDINVIFFSTVTNEGMDEVKKAIGKTL